MSVDIGDRIRAFGKLVGSLVVVPVTAPPPNADKRDAGDSDVNGRPSFTTEDPWSVSIDRDRDGTVGHIDYSGPAVTSDELIERAASDLHVTVGEVRALAPVISMRATACFPVRYRVTFHKNAAGEPLPVDDDAMLLPVGADDDNAKSMITVGLGDPWKVLFSAGPLIMVATNNTPFVGMGMALTVGFFLISTIGLMGNDVMFCSVSRDGIALRVKGRMSRWSLYLSIRRALRAARRKGLEPAGIDTSTSWARSRAAWRLSGSCTALSRDDGDMGLVRLDWRPVRLPVERDDDTGLVNPAEIDAMLPSAHEIGMAIRYINLTRDVSSMDDDDVDMIRSTKRELGVESMRVVGKHHRRAAADMPEDIPWERLANDYIRARDSLAALDARDDVDADAAARLRGVLSAAMSELSDRGVESMTPTDASVLADRCDDSVGAAATEVDGLVRRAEALSTVNGFIDDLGDALELKRQREAERARSLRPVVDKAIERALAKQQPVAGERQRSR
jgi:hypothetical protein